MIDLGVWIPLAECRRLPAVCGLYIVRHTESGKEYVGKSVNVRHRAGDHRRAKTGATYLYRAVRKHGIGAFEICLHAVGTEEEVTVLEIAVIAARGTFNPAGYNQTCGGDGVSGYRATPEHRAAIVARQTGRPITEEAKAKMRAWALENNAFRGKKHTPETLVKMSEASKRQAIERPISAEGRASIARANARKLGTKHSDHTKALISAKLKGGKKPEGFGVGLHTGEKNAMHGRKGAKHPRAVQVLAWPPGSMTPLTFPTSDAAAAWAGCSITSMSSYCNGTQRAKSGAVFAHT